MANYRYLGYGITNEQGIAHLDHDANGNPIDHSYTGTGAGELDIIASLDDNTHISDSSIQSETYEVCDAVFYDVGTTGTLFSEWVNPNGSAISSSFYEADNTGVTFKDETGNWRYFMANRTGTDKTDVNDYSEPVVVEFDVVEWTSTGAYIQHKTTTKTASALGITGECKFKAVYDGSTIKYYVDDEEVTSQRVNLNLGTFRIGFVCNNGYIKFKNFRIYLI